MDLILFCVREMLVRLGACLGEYKEVLNFTAGDRLGSPVLAGDNDTARYSVAMIPLVAKGHGVIKILSLLEVDKR